MLEQQKPIALVGPKESSKWHSVNTHMPAQKINGTKDDTNTNVRSGTHITHHISVTGDKNEKVKGVEDPDGHILEADGYECDICNQSASFVTDSGF